MNYRKESDIICGKLNDIFLEAVIRVDYYAEYRRAFFFFKEKKQERVLELKTSMIKEQGNEACVEYLANKYRGIKGEL
jgi:hypothetical protein